MNTAFEAALVVIVVLGVGLGLGLLVLLMRELFGRPRLR